MSKYFILFTAILVGNLTSQTFASEPKICGGISGISCETDHFCEFPIGTCGVGDLEGQCTQRPEVCTTEHEPVIGCDGRQYSNSCMAASAGVSILHPHIKPQDLNMSDPNSESQSPEDVQVLHQQTFQGKVRSNGAVEHRRGRWSVVETRIDQATSTTRMRIRFSRSVRHSVILSTPYCTFSDHGPASVGVGFVDDRTVDFVYEAPCGFPDFAGLDFLIVR